LTPLPLKMPSSKRFWGETSTNILTINVKLKIRVSLQVFQCLFDKVKHWLQHVCLDITFLLRLLQSRRQGAPFWLTVVSSGKVPVYSSRKGNPG
jgi:hypothetical protein